MAQLARSNAFIWLAIVALSPASFSQTQQQTPGPQIANNATCSNTRIDAKGNVVFRCSGLTPGQAKTLDQLPALAQRLLRSQRADAIQIIEKLDLVLAKQDNFNILAEKLDQIISSQNPNQQTKTYFCNGQWRTSGPGAHAAFEMSMGGDDSLFKQMVDLANSGQYRALLDLCRSAKQSNPGWLTPYLLQAFAELNLGETDQARNDLKYFDSNEGPAYEVDGCKQVVDVLHAQLGTKR